MLDHIGVDVSDVARSRAFYEAALAPLGYRVLDASDPGATGADTVVLFGIDTPDFVIARDQAPGRGNHIAFRAETRAAVDAFHAAALAAGGTDNGAPGLRPHYGPTYYAAFVIDPDGFNIEAVCHDADGLLT
ncbi:glyoxalase/bleomycin resistance/extradiol dioxygenase family protein [Brevundimonas sp. LM2]|uniref:VOC family protein n=1 Tax=Brevundimonas sp. LM2 TaxID=1938605 RepID=UPI00098394DD|nr:VOC family protein [Brevundimonas sp. LM2]AQR63323.1 glyoxalase/bleomycin resistance/extradiol dioxygenase family protein [Brevundimonas sp. LM2]